MLFSGGGNAAGSGNPPFPGRRRDKADASACETPPHRLPDGPEADDGRGGRDAFPVLRDIPGGLWSNQK